MSFVLPLALGVASGLANLFSGQSQAREDRKRRRAATSILEQNLVSENELNSLLNQNTRIFNQSLGSLLNTTAIRSRGIANRGVIGAAVASGLEGQKLQAATTIEQGAREQNRNIRSQIAELQLGGAAEDPIGDFVSGAIPGITSGIELTRFLQTPTEDQETQPEGVINTPMTTNISQGPIGQARNPYIDYLGDDQVNRRNRLLNMNFLYR